MDKRDRKELKRELGRFLVVGLLSVATDLGGYFCLIRLAGFSPHLAKGISYVMGTVVGYFLNKYWTFESPRRSLSEPVFYAALYALTLAVNVGCNGLVLSLLGDNGKPLAFLAATGVTTVLNFLGLKFITFRQGVEERLGK